MPFPTEPDTDLTLVLLGGELLYQRKPTDPGLREMYRWEAVHPDALFADGRRLAWEELVAWARAEGWALREVTFGATYVEEEK